LHHHQQLLLPLTPLLFPLHVRFLLHHQRSHLQQTHPPTFPL